MSTITPTKERSLALGEPEWLYTWRVGAEVFANTFSPLEYYGISIPALEVLETPLFESIATYDVSSSKGLELYTWKEAVAQEEIAVILERLFVSTLVPQPASLVAARARALFGSGLVVYVQPTLDDKGNALKETLTLNTTLPQGASADVIVVIAKTGSHLALENIVQGGKEGDVFARMMIVLTEEDAHVEVVSTVKESGAFVSVESTLLVGAHATCHWREDPSGEMRYRSRVEAKLLGEGARSEIFHALIADKKSSYDIWAGAKHSAPSTYSRVNALGLAGGHAHIVYRGNIDMKQGVAGLDGAQEGKFLMVSKTASIDAIPALDIASKDVHSTHKLSVSHIRDVDIFFAKTRGIGEADARALAVLGFFGTLLSNAQNEELANAVRARIEAIAFME